MIAFDNHDYQKAKEQFLKAIENNPQQPENYFFLGQAHFLCEEPHEAIAPLNTYIKLKQPGLPKQTITDDVMNVAYAFDILGQCYEAEKKDTNALHCYKTATQIHPKCASAWHNMGLMYIKSASHYLQQDLNQKLLATINQLFDGAKLFLKNALENSPANPNFLQSMASWYKEYTEIIELIITEEILAREQITDHFKQAIELYQKAINACGQQDLELACIIQINLAECYAQYGHHIYKRGQYTDAQSLYLEAVTLNPKHLDALSQMGMCCFKQQNYTEAKNWFCKILEKTTEAQELADAYLNIACTYRHEKNWEKAEEALATAFKLALEDEYILKEQIALAEDKLRAIHVSSPQTLFARPNAVSDDIPESDLQMNRQHGS